MLTSVVVSAPRLKSKLDHIRRLVDEGWVEDVTKVGERVRDYLRENTPRSSGEKGSQNGEHIADGWELHRIGGSPRSGRGILLVVYNRFVTNVAGKILARARLTKHDIVQGGGGKADYTLMHVLEYGSRPHRIFPFKKKVLRFISSQGNVVFTNQVDHPGTKPHGMIRQARALAADWFTELHARWRRKLGGVE